MLLQLVKKEFAYNSSQARSKFEFFSNFSDFNSTLNKRLVVFPINKKHKSLLPISSFPKFSFNCLNVLEIQSRKYGYQRVLGYFQILVEKMDLVFSKWSCNRDISTNPACI